MTFLEDFIFGRSMVDHKWKTHIPSCDSLISECFLSVESGGKDGRKETGQAICIIVVP